MNSTQKSVVRCPSFFRLILCQLVLLGWVVSFADSSRAQAQTAPADKAVLAFSADMEKVLQSKTLKALFGDDSPLQFFQLEGENAAMSETAIIYGNMAKFEGYIAAPKGPLGPDAFESANMLVILEMKDAAGHKKVREMMKDGFVEIEKDGKTILQADGPGAPPWFARMDGKKIIIGTEDYLFAKPESVCQS